jgi:hypothetical protein
MNSAVKKTRFTYWTEWTGNIKKMMHIQWGLPQCQGLIKKVLGLTALCRETCRTGHYSPKPMLKQSKSKAIPVTGSGGPHCLHNWLTDGGKVVSPTHRLHFTPHKKKKKNSMVWVRERTIPTERPPLLGEVLPTCADNFTPHKHYYFNVSVTHFC